MGEDHTAEHNMLRASLYIMYREGGDTLTKCITNKHG